MVHSLACKSRRDIEQKYCILACFPARSTCDKANILGRKIVWCFVDSDSKLIDNDKF